MRYHEARGGHRHQTLTVWARPMLHVVRRWQPDRDLVVVGDRSYAALPWLAACQALPFLTRLRLDAALYAPAPPPTPGPVSRATACRPCARS